MTVDKHVKRAARELAAREGISYTDAVYRVRGRASAGQDQEEPPRVVLIAHQPCPEGCDGSTHRGAVCRLWRPEDAYCTVRWEVCRAATLHQGRADQLARRSEGDRPYSYPVPDDAWLLALAYAMLTNQRPELLPDRARLRAAVEADDPAAVDTAMEPLDRAAARLMTKQAATWWGEVKPRLDSYAATVDADDREPRTWEEVKARQQVESLVSRWRTAWTPVLKSNGYTDAPSVMWIAVKGWLDDRLVDEHGGYGPGARVRLTDGRPALVYEAEWGDCGPPLAYRVRELEPGRHGNVGHLVPSLRSNLLVPAADCRDDSPCVTCGGTAGMPEALCDSCAARLIR
ncbi:hypothetical protein ACWEBX_03235 [Streptomyces sp. NPDC005070]